MAVQDARLSSKEWRMSHLYKIPDKKTGKVVVFKKNRMQAHFDENKHTFNIILKSRQLGMTAFQAIDMLDDSMFSKENYNGLFVAHTKDAASSIFDKKLKFYWQSVHEVIRKLFTLEKDSADELKVGRGDGSFGSVIVANSGRGDTLSRVHVSEFAKLCILYPQRALEIVTGTISAVFSGGRMDIESTAEGETGYFHDMFWDAWNDGLKGVKLLPKQFKAHFYNWQWDDDEIGKVTDEEIENFLKSTDFPAFDEYREKMKAHDVTISDKELTHLYKMWLSLQKSWKLLHQEFPTIPSEAFIGSGNKLFDASIIAQQEIKKPITIDGDWSIYEEFMPGQFYVMGADVAEGVGQDSSTAVVLKVSSIPYQVVATFKNNRIEPDKFAYELARYGARYGNCIIAPEVNSIGHTTVTKLKEIYSNVFRAVDPKKNLEQKTRFTNPVKTLRYGWRTTGTSKPLMMYELNDALNEGELEVNDATLLTELRTYDRENLSQIRFDDKQTNHWDMVIALAIAYQMRNKVSRGKTKAFAIPN